MATKGLEELQALEDTGDVEVLDELQEISAEALAKQGEEAPVVRLVNVVLMSAIQKGASDIHVGAIREGSGFATASTAFSTTS